MIKKFIFLTLVTSMFFACSITEETDYSTLNTKSNTVSDLKNQLISVKNSSSYGALERTEDDLIEEFEQEQVQNETLTNSIAVLHSFGITDDDIIDEFGSLDNPNIVATALAVVRIDEVSQAGYSMIDLETGYNYSADSYVDITLNQNLTDPSTFDCAMDALGIPVALIVGTAQGVGRKALLKAAKKLATRFLGWAGAAVAVYEFGDCMDWW